MNTKQIIYGLILLGLGIFIGSYFTGGNSNMSHDHNGDVSTSNESAATIYTCSMHPQIQQPEPGLCPICGMDLIPLAASTDNDDPTVLQMTSAAVALSQIETTVVGSPGTKSEQNAISVEGVLTLDERTLKSQTSHLSGRIEKMMVNFEGDYVKKGQLIVRLYSTDLLAASQELITAIKYEGKVEGILEAAKQKLRNWKISETQINQIATSGEAISTIDVFAEHNGYVIKKMKSLGDYVNVGSSLYTVATTAKVWAIFNVFESDISNVKIGNQITFTTPSLGNEMFNARVTYINPLLNPTTKTAEVRAEVSSKGKLKPGMLIKGTISGSKRKSGDEVVVPKSAILWTGNSSVVYVKLPDSEVPSFQFREVHLGESLGDGYVVKSGVSSGEEVVTNGAFVIDASAQLNNNSSMMNRNVTISKEGSSLIPNFKDHSTNELQVLLAGIVGEYLSLKDALTETDSELASNNGNKLYTKVLSYTEESSIELKHREANIYLNDRINVIKQHSLKLRDSKDVEVQRTNFEFISNAVIELLTAFGTDRGSYFVQHCPMVDNNRGADWISMEKEIRNPYFGDKMMTCGVVKKEISK